MRVLVEKLQNIEQSLSDRHGSFLLFALFQREDAGNAWDLLVSAKWIEDDGRRKGLETIVKSIRETLSKSERDLISKVVVVPPDDPALGAITHAVGVKHGLCEIADSVFFGMRISHAYVITSRRDAA